MERINKKKKFVKNGLFYAELNEFLRRELAEDGYAGCEVRVTPKNTEVVIKATRTEKVLGENPKGRRINELTSVIQKRFDFPEGGIEVFADRVKSRGLSAMAQCESLKFKLASGLAVRRACYSVLRFVMDAGAKGCEVSVSGKLRAQRAKTMKFKDGYMIKTGFPAVYSVDTAVRHVYMKQGILGIKVSIMLPVEGIEDKWGVGKIKSILPDTVEVREPKEEAAVPAVPMVERLAPAASDAITPQQPPVEAQ